MKTSRIGLMLCVILFGAFQLLTLNHPKLSSDEAIFGIIGFDHLKTLMQGHWPSTLTPVQPYLGPLDMWLLGAMTAIPHFFSGIEPAPWLLRLLPLLCTWAGAIVLAREVAKKSGDIAWLVLMVSIFWPINAIHGKVGWAPSFCLGIFSTLLGESLRMVRTGRPRWWLIGFLSGISMEFHPVSAVGILPSF